MNLPAQGLQSTWPQGTVSIALRVFERAFLHAGHMRVEGSVDEVDSVVVKLMGMRDLRDSG